MLPAVLDPWAGHALYEAAHLAARASPAARSGWWPRPQGQAAAGDDDGGPEGAVRTGGPGRPGRRLHRRARDVGRSAGRGHAEAIPAWTASRLLLFGGWESASRGAGVTLQMVGERLGHPRPVPGRGRADRAGRTARCEILERVEGGQHQVSVCAGPAGGAGLGHRQPARAARTTRRSAWPTCAASCRRCRRPSRRAGRRRRRDVRSRWPCPRQQRETRIVKDMTPDEIAREIVEWIRQD